MLLTIENLFVSYGGIRALKDVSFEVAEGEIVALIGANGAGKSTTLKTICGLVRPEAGNISYNGKNLNKTPPYKIVAMGISLVPEGRRVFTRLTVMENLEMGAYTRGDSREVKESLKNAFERFPRLEERKSQLAGTLSGGEQQMLAMSRALMSKPRLLLLDEPSMGLAPMLVKEIFSIITKIKSSGTTILLVEQNAHMALSIADRAYVLETGEIVLSGPASEMIWNPQVRKVYLGE